MPPAFRTAAALLNWGTILLAAGGLYYFVMSWSLALGMMLFVAAVITSVVWLERLPGSLWLVSLALFVVAWIGQFIGHHYEGRRPSFFKDLQFLLIGPDSLGPGARLAGRACSYFGFSCYSAAADEAG